MWSPCLSKSIFDIHNPVGIKRLYQLRVGLIPLYDHKWKHGFKDVLSDRRETGNCTESLEHNFFYCTRYVEARRPLLNSVMTLNVVNFGQFQSKDKIKLLLYGDSSLSNAANKLLIEATINFFSDTERFL